jgi:hypothetical protein
MTVLEILRKIGNIVVASIAKAIILAIVAIFSKSHSHFEVVPTVGEKGGAYV